VTWLIHVCMCVCVGDASITISLYSCVTWLSHMCDVSHSFVWHDSFMCVCVCVSVMHRSPSRCIHVWRDSVICVTWLIHLCDVTHSCVYVCVCRWCIDHHLVVLMFDVTHLCVWHDSVMCVTWLSHVCDMTQSCVWHDSFMCVCMCMSLMHRPSHCIHVWRDAFIRVTRLSHMCLMTHSCVWHDSFLCVTWYLSDISFICVTFVSRVCDSYSMRDSWFYGLYVNESRHSMTESRHTYEWVMPHIWGCIAFQISPDYTCESCRRHDSDDLTQILCVNHDNMCCMCVSCRRHVHTHTHTHTHTSPDYECEACHNISRLYAGGSNVVSPTCTHTHTHTHTHLESTCVSRIMCVTSPNISRLFVLYLWVMSPTWLTHMIWRDLECVPWLIHLWVTWPTHIIWRYSDSMREVWLCVFVCVSYRRHVHTHTHTHTHVSPDYMCYICESCRQQNSRIWSGDIQNVCHDSWTWMHWSMSDMTHTCNLEIFRMCAKTHSYVCHDSFYVCHDSFYVWHDSFICVTWLIHMCGMTHSYVWQDSFTWVLRSIHMWVTWLTHIIWSYCDMTHTYNLEICVCVCVHVHTSAVHRLRS